MLTLLEIIQGHPLLQTIGSVSNCVSVLKRSHIKYLLMSCEISRRVYIYTFGVHTKISNRWDSVLVCGEDSVSRVLAAQAWSYDFGNLGPAERSGHTGARLWPKGLRNRDRRTPETLWPTGLSESVNPWFIERHCLNNESEWWRKKFQVNLCPPCMHQPMYKHISHTYTHRKSSILIVKV